MHRSPRGRNRSWDLESPATGYRRLKRIVLSVLTRENSKSRCRRMCEMGGEVMCSCVKGWRIKNRPSILSYRFILTIPNTLLPTRAIIQLPSLPLKSPPTHPLETPPQANGIPIPPGNLS